MAKDDIYGNLVIYNYGRKYTEENPFEKVHHVEKGKEKEKELVRKIAPGICESLILGMEQRYVTIQDIGESLLGWTWNIDYWEQVKIKET